MNGFWIFLGLCLLAGLCLPSRRTVYRDESYPEPEYDYDGGNHDCDCDGGE